MERNYTAAKALITAVAVFSVLGAVLFIMGFEQAVIMLGLGTPICLAVSSVGAVLADRAVKEGYYKAETAAKLGMFECFICTVNMLWLFPIGLFAYALSQWPP